MAGPDRVDVGRTADRLLLHRAGAEPQRRLRHGQHAADVDAAGVVPGAADALLPGLRLPALAPAVPVGVPRATRIRVSERELIRASCPRPGQPPASGCPGCAPATAKRSDLDPLVHLFACPVFDGLWGKGAA